VIRDAASVILLRPASRGFEVLFLRRHRGASFMASSYVFPGGGADPGEDIRTTAVRELREEAAVTLDPAVLVPWAHWITPSIEPRRFSAHFFVAQLPAGQEPRFDRKETVDQVWLAPLEAIARAGELQLPPPQLRTCWELGERATIEAVLAAGHARGAEPHAIQPRHLPADRPVLVLPWDAEYLAGTGDATPMLSRPSWARGPSRFVMEDRRWTHVEGPGSTSAG
jgi:8-oxo-dGTP pyrophosphatase MutT (NUDIX family)